MNFHYSLFVGDGATFFITPERSHSVILKHSRPRYYRISHRDPSRRRPTVILERSEESRGGLLEDDTMGDEVQRGAAKQKTLGGKAKNLEKNCFVSQTNYSLPQRGRWMRRKEQTDEESCGRSVYREQEW